MKQTCWKPLAFFFCGDRAFALGVMERWNLRQLHFPILLVVSQPT